MNAWVSKPVKRKHCEYQNTVVSDTSKPLIKWCCYVVHFELEDLKTYFTSKPILTDMSILFVSCKIRLVAFTRV